MFDLKVVCPTEIAEKVKEYCELGVRPGRNRYLLCIGCGNDNLITKIVLRTIVWMDSPEKIAERKRLGQTLAWVVAAETYNVTQESFSWTSVCKVIENAGNQQIAKHLIDTFANDCRHEAQVFNYRPDLNVGNVKTSMTRLAKAILWVEAYTFLLEEDYDYNQT